LVQEPAKSPLKINEKKPSSPFISFYMEKRAGLLLEQPHLSTPEVGR
jgi:hypothetical protein